MKAEGLFFFTANFKLSVVVVAVVCSSNNIYNNSSSSINNEPRPYNYCTIANTAGIDHHCIEPQPLCVLAMYLASAAPLVASAP